MSSTLALALQITATNGAAGVLSGIRQSLSQMGRISKETAQHFDAMTRSLQKAGNAFAASAYLNSKMKPGVEAAADLEEAMNRVKGNIAQVGDKASDLAAKLKQVRDTARDVSKVMPYSAKDVVDIQGAMLKSGVDISAVVGKQGAAYSAAGLATISGIAPGEVGDMLARIGKQYNFKPEDYKPAADLLMKGEAASPGSLQEMLYSLKQFGTTAATLGVSFKDAVTMSAAMTPLNMEAGTAVNRYMLDSIGLTSKQRQSMIEAGLASTNPDGGFNNHLYKNGKYIGLDAQNRMVREKFSAMKDDAKKTQLAHDIWGQEGMRAALLTGGAGDLFGDMQKQMALSLGMEDRMKITMNGFNMAIKAAAGTVQTLLATAFDPALGKATALANKVNDIADHGAQWLGEHPTANKAITGTAAAAATGVAAYAAYNLFKSAGSGYKAIKGFLGDSASTAKGVAQGKAIEAATGVTPVFVTNWGDAKGGTVNSAAEVAAAAGAGGMLTKLKDLAKVALLFGSSNIGTIARGGALALGTAGASVAAAGSAGYAAGALAMETQTGQQFAGWLADQAAKIMAAIGDKQAQQMVVNLHLDGQQITQVVNTANTRTARRN